MTKKMPTKPPNKSVKSTKSSKSAGKSAVKASKKPVAIAKKAIAKSATKANFKGNALAKVTVKAPVLKLIKGGKKTASPAVNGAAKKGAPAKAATPLPVKLVAVKGGANAKTTTYKLGDVLFYPRQGLCRYEMTVHEVGMDFLLLKPVNGVGHATIRVPVGNATRVGLRRPSATMTFDAACAVLRKLSNDFESDWRKRNQLLTDFTMRGETTDHLAAAKILAIQDAVKPLSHQERRQYEQIVQFAADEIALIEQGTSATVALNLMEYMRSITMKNRPPASGTFGR